MTTLDIDEELSKLAVGRPNFHSEADFQFSLAWQIQKDHPDAKIRLEARPVRNQRVDIDVQLEDERGVHQVCCLMHPLGSSGSGPELTFLTSREDGPTRHASRVCPVVMNG